MTGMTPAWLTLSGMYVDEPPNILRPTMRRAYCTGMRRWPCSMKMTAAMSTSPMAVTSAKTHQPRETLTCPQGGREGRDDLGEDQDRHAVADAAVGDELTEPHDDRGAGGHRDHQDQHGHQAVLLVEEGVRAALEQLPAAGQRHDAGGLQDRERQGEVAGVLGDLGLAGLALVLEGLQPRDHHDEQLQDDARGDVRHDAEREDRQLQQRPAGEQVDQAVEAVVLRARRSTPGRSRR